MAAVCMWENDGIPIRILDKGVGYNVICELKNDELFRGKLVATEGNMNLQMTSVTRVLKSGKEFWLDSVLLRGSQVKFVILPDFLKRSPIFLKYSENPAERTRGPPVRKMLPPLGDRGDFRPVVKYNPSAKPFFAISSRSSRNPYNDKSNFQPTREQQFTPAEQPSTSSGHRPSHMLRGSTRGYYTGSTPHQAKYSHSPRNQQSGPNWCSSGDTQISHRVDSRPRSRNSDDFQQNVQSDYQSWNTREGQHRRSMAAREDHYNQQGSSSGMTPDEQQYYQQSGSHQLSRRVDSQPRSANTEVVQQNVQSDYQSWNTREEQQCRSMAATEEHYYQQSSSSGMTPDGQQYCQQSGSHQGPENTTQYVSQDDTQFSNTNRFQYNQPSSSQWPAYDQYQQGAQYEPSEYQYAQRSSSHISPATSSAGSQQGHQEYHQHQF